MKIKELNCAISSEAIRNHFSVPRGKIEKNRRLFSNEYKKNY